MPNFDGVWEMRLFYTSTLSTAPVLPHVMRFDVAMLAEGSVGDPMGNFELVTRVGTPIMADIFIDAFMDLLEPCYSADAEFSRMELWNIPEGTFDATFYSVLEIGHAGSNAGANVLSQQTTFSFRSSGGGTGRIQLMESVFGGSARQSAPYALAIANNLTNYVIGTTSPILARDNTPFVARINQSDGQNEAVWRKRNRL